MLERGWLSHELTLGRVGEAHGEQVALFGSGGADGLQAVLLASPS